MRAASWPRLLIVILTSALPCGSSASPEAGASSKSLANQEPLLTLKGHRDGIFCVAYSPDGRRLASAGRDHLVKIWDSASGKEVLTLKGHTNQVLRLAFS